MALVEEKLVVFLTSKNRRQTEFNSLMWEPIWSKSIKGNWWIDFEFPDIIRDWLVDRTIYATMEVLIVGMFEAKIHLHFNEIEHAINFRLRWCLTWVDTNPEKFRTLIVPASNELFRDFERFFGGSYGNKTLPNLHLEIENWGEEFGHEIVDVVPNTNVSSSLNALDTSGSAVAFKLRWL
jgi:hypothetical protein